MSHQQLSIDYELLALPRPQVTNDQIRKGDVVIGEEPLEVPRQLKHGVEVLWAIEELNREGPLSDLIYPKVEVGYTQIYDEIKDLRGLTLARSSIEFTVKELLRLGFLKCTRPPAFKLCAEYQTLTPKGKGAMLCGVNATHFRVYRNQVLLIAPPCGSPYVI